jgi:hypothetical protein
LTTGGIAEDIVWTRSKAKFMSEEPNPNDKKFSLIESVVRVLGLTFILAIIVNVVVLCVIAWITGQSRG